ncbi:DUF411 domain-containing protein [Sinorhizobium sp. CCBAU 05631]|uniref:DUF411 domain-containing protein n=1 Tax=Sinorhizobium sp. CCBAU 05631 TaxID=794846 RepID=UPI0004ADE9D5|nr:DUF411 domain-containing protein [Sinorhizobium sp. CCBAU 05631]ASY60038.1 CopG protein [Sinorhizobium sp. CCBAU 05631]
MTIHRRDFLAGTLACACVVLLGAPTPLAGAVRMVIYKDPGCGCCESWAAAMREAGFAVEVHNESDMTAIKRRFAVPPDMAACHTAVLDGYLIEGHVPLEAIRKLLAERPNIPGLAVPGMPVGSLGMGDDPQAAYEVYALSRIPGAAPTIFHSVRPAI